MKTIAFFYGTLRTGYWNNPRCISEKSKLLGIGKTVDNFQMFVEQRIPCLIHPPLGCRIKGYNIVGEVWELCERDAERVHYLERGYGDEMIQVRLENGSEVTAKIYYAVSGEMPCYYTGHQVEVTSGNFEDAVKKAI